MRILDGEDYHAGREPVSYCLAIQTDRGLVFASDSRTHGGVDQVNAYSKMHRFEVSGERVFVLLSAGNLSTTQSVVHRIDRQFEKPAGHGLLRAATLFDAAEYVGGMSRDIRNDHVAHNADANFDASFLIGGQIRGQAPEICLIYPEGNCIRAPAEKPFLQIGETQYGKPILDRIVTPSTPLDDAARCALVSLDSTMRSNLAVGPPIELAIYERDALRLSRHERYEADAPWLLDLQASWSATVARGMRVLPRFPWERSETEAP